MCDRKIKQLIGVVGADTLDDKASDRLSGVTIDDALTQQCR
jgi:hypothetical protein